MKNIFKKTEGEQRRTRLGSFSLIGIAVAIVAVIVVNLLVSSLPSRLTKFDMSAEDLYTLSEDTEKLVADVDADITMYQLLGSSSSTYSDMIWELLSRYASINSHIKVEQVDITLNPTFYQSYTDKAPSQNSVIVSSSLRSKVVDYSDIVVTTQTPNYQTMSYDTTYEFAGEAQMTSAIEYVTSDNLPVVYLLNGNGESSLSSDFSSILADDNFRTEQLSLITGDGKVPSDASCVLLNVPQNDLSGDEVSALEEYINGGGKVIMITYYPYTLANLNALGERYGLSRVPGLLVEGSDSMYASGKPYYLLPSIESTDISSMLSASNVYIIAPEAHGIQKVDTDKTVTVDALLSTSDKAYSKTNLETLKNETIYSVTDEDIEGQFMVAARSTLSESGGQLIWFGTPYLGKNYYANLQYLIATMNTVCEKEASVTIAAKSLMSDSLTVPDGSSSFWLAIMCVVVPVAVTASGLYVWNRRRKR